MQDEADVRVARSLWFGERAVTHASAISTRTLPVCPADQRRCRSAASSAHLAVTGAAAVQAPRCRMALSGESLTAAMSSKAPACRKS